MYKLAENKEATEEKVNKKEYQYPKAPLAKLCLCMLVFIFAFFDLSFVTKIILYLLFIATGIYSLIFSRLGKGKRPYTEVILICISGILAISIIMTGHDLPKKSAEKYRDTYNLHEVKGYFTSAHHVSEYSSAHFVKITEYDGEKVNFNAYLSFQDNIRRADYECFRAFLYFDSASEYTELNLTQKSFDAKRVFLGSDRVMEFYFTGERAEGILPFFGILNEKICGLVNRMMNENDAALINALLFGDKEHLPNTLSRDFMTMGITHMLVVSGMNIALIANEFDKFIHLFIRKRIPRMLVCCLICLFYMALCKFTLSVVRAALMQIIFRMSVLAARDYDSHTSLFLSMGIIVLFDPAAIYDVGLMLSFFATLGIITFSAYAEDSLEKMPSLLREILGSLIASVSACIFVLPLSFAFFGATSLMAPIFTLAFSFLLDALLFATPVMLALSVFPILSHIAVFFCGAICDVVYAFSNLAVHFKDFYVSLGGGNGTVLSFLVIISVVISIFVIKGKKNKLLKLVPAFSVYIIITLILLFFTSSHGLFYISDGENDGFICAGKEGVVFLDVSEGKGSFTKTVQKGISEYAPRVTNIDFYVISHIHTAHIAQVYKLAAEGYLECVAIPIPVNETERNVMENIWTLAREFDFALMFYEYGNEISVGGGEFLFYKPTVTDRNLFHKVLCFKVRMGDDEAVYLGQNIAEAGGVPEFDLFEYTDAVIMGAHFPTIREPFTYMHFPKDMTLILAKNDYKQPIKTNLKEYHPPYGIPVKID